MRIFLGSHMFCQCDQIKFNELVLRQEHQNSSISLTTNCKRLLVKKLAVIWKKITLYFNCKHMPADGGSARTKCERLGRRQESDKPIQHVNDKLLVVRNSYLDRILAKPKGS